MILEAETTIADAYTWAQCPGCGARLWRRYPDRLEMVVNLRGGERRTISAPLNSIGLRVICEKCDATWQSGPNAS